MNDCTAEPGVGGVTQFTSRLLSPNFRVGGWGWSGRASGRATAEEGDGSEVPTEFVAVTVKVYSTSLVRPSSVQVVEAHCFEYPCGLVTVYDVMSQMYRELMKGITGRHWWNEEVGDEMRAIVVSVFCLSFFVSLLYRLSSYYACASSSATELTLLLLLD